MAELTQENQINMEKNISTGLCIEKLKQQIRDSSIRQTSQISKISKLYVIIFVFQKSPYFGLHE